MATEQTHCHKGDCVASTAGCYCHCLMCEPATDYRAEVASLRSQLAAANEARAEAERQRDEAQADLFRIRDIAGVWERRAGQLANEICEEREQWQDATGLTDGSDPGGVTPAMLSSVMGRFYDLEEASRALIGHEVTLCLVDPPCGNCDACRFGVAIAALPKED